MQQKENAAENLIKVDIDVVKDDADNSYRIQVYDANTGALTPFCEIPSIREVVEILKQFGISGQEIVIATSTWQPIRNKMIDINQMQRLLEPYHPRE